MLKKASSWHKRRLIYLSFFLFFSFCLLIGQFYKIQIIEGEKWAKEAKMQHQTVVIQPFMRGCIYANPILKEGHPESLQALAVDIPKFHLYVDPEAIPEMMKRDFVEELFSHFSVDLKKKAFISRQLQKKSRSRKLFPFLDPEEKERIMTWWDSYAKKKKLPRNALYAVLDFKRSHPFGSLLGQVLHTIQDEKEQHTLQGLPTGGLELQFHSFLKGKQGKRICYRSPRNTLEMGPILEHPENGSDVYLTINHYIQAITERELEKGVKEANAKGGWAIMMHPHTGEIYALAQYPFFNPENYREYFNVLPLQEHTKIKAITDAFEPGSVFKPIILSIGLLANEEWLKSNKKKLFDPEEKMATHTGTFSGTSFTLKDARVHKYLNFFMALQKSSNVYVGKIVQKILENLGEEWYRKKIVDTFSFGKKTGIELPGESSGTVPKAGKVHPNGTLEWSAPTPYTLGIGHNILVNSLQMVKAFALFANGGWEVHPTILKKIVRNNGEVIFDGSMKDPKKRLLNENITKEMTKALKYVTKVGGTSPRGDIKGYTEAGKSGTSEKIINGKYSKDAYISSFIGFAPAHNPVFVLLVVIDEPEVKFIPNVGKNYHGGVCAAPVFREIAQKTLEYLGVFPDDPLSLENNSSQKDWQEETAQLRKTYEEWNR